MPVRILLIALVLAACSQPAGRNTRPPDPTETPPTTNDPGRTEDSPPTPTLPPPEAPDAGAGAATPGGGAPSTTAGGALRPDGQFCLAGGECASGICEGQGCGDDSPGRCVARARGCTRDLREYCGCDGKTFRASGSCPLRRFSARGTCVGS